MDLNFLMQYLGTNSPAGFEEATQRFFLTEAKKYVRDNDEVYIDHIGNGYVSIKADSDIENPTCVVLEAHVDEISFRIESFRDGCAYLMENGGIDPGISPGRKVVAIKQNGELVPGVIGKLTPHSDKKAFTLGELFVDFCVSREDFNKLGLRVGDPVVFESTPSRIGEYVVSKALDNKVGGFVWLEVLKRHMERIAKTGKSPFNLVLLNSVQEEIGKKGATIAINNFKPDIVFVYDVGHASPAYNTGGGPLIITSPVLNKNLLNFLLHRTFTKLPKTQFKVRPKGKITRTNADVFSDHCPTLLMQISLKYMHSVVEMVSEKDILGSIKIGSTFLDELSKTDSKQFSDKVYI